MTKTNLNNFKKSCIELRKRDFTLGEICNQLGRPKSSVHYHIKNMPLNEKTLEMVNKSKLIKLKKYSQLKKGKSKRAFRTYDAWNANLVSLIAHLMFDGEIKYHACIYNNRNKALIQKVSTFMKELYDYPPRQIMNGEVIRISYFNVELAHYLKQKSINLIETIENMPIDFKKIFLQSFFDDEGCVSFGYCKRQVRGYQHNRKVLLLIQRLLVTFEINSKIYSKGNEIIISKKENLERFNKEIGFSENVFINGNRPNSIWKKHLEKREILSRMLKSYKTDLRESTIAPK